MTSFWLISLGYSEHNNEWYGYIIESLDKLSIKIGKLKKNLYISS